MTNILLPSGGVDTHAHVFEPGLAMAADRRYTPAYAAALTTYLRLLDENGLRYGVLVQPSFLGVDNSHLIDALHRSKGRCKGVAVVDPACGPEELQRLNQAGVTGIRLNLFGLALPALDAPVWTALLAEINRLHWHVEVHCPGTQLSEVVPPLLDAGCRVVVDHFGRPDFSGGTNLALVELLCDLGVHGRLWVKLSASYRVWREADPQGHAAAVDLLVARLGPHRLMWGSDWPHTQHENGNSLQQSLQQLTGAVPDPVVLEQILVGTPHNFFGF